MRVMVNRGCEGSVYRERESQWAEGMEVTVVSGHVGDQWAESGNCPGLDETAP